MNISFKNKIIILTGCNGYLGKSICESLHNSGGEILGLDINKKTNIKLNNFKYFKVDLSKNNEIDKFFTFLKKKKISPSILINNAALSYKGSYQKRKQNEINSMINVNIISLFNMIKNFSEISNKKSNILNIASIYGLISPKPDLYKRNKADNSEIYGATKAGVIQMTKYFARYLSNKEIRVNCISPGGILTSENKKDKFFISKYIQDVPLKRLANSEEIVNAILFLISEQASYINGQNLIVDGGKSC